MTTRNIQRLMALAALALILAAGPAPGAELRVDGQREFGTEVELAWTLRVDYKMVTVQPQPKKGK